MNRIIKFFLVVWVIMTVAALIGMFHLWWTRERVLYFGKSVRQQRAEVFQRVGFGNYLLEGVEKIDISWPAEARYSALGDHNQLSYVKYLLLPRIPSGNEKFKLIVEDAKLDFQPVLQGVKGFVTEQSKAKSLIYSFLILFGIVILMGSWKRLAFLSIPEKFAIVVFLNVIFVMISRGFTGYAVAGFWAISSIGISGWLIGFVNSTKNILRRRKKAEEFINRRGRRTKKGKCISNGLLAGLVIVVFLWSMAMSIIVVPDDWDAWAMWGGKAKTLALGYGPLKDVTYFGHADYPLLWPSVWSFSGWCGGGWEEHWSRGWGPVFMLFSAWEIGIIVLRMTGRYQIGLLVAGLFLSVPMVPLLASWSYAEAPLWLMFICSYGYIILWEKEKKEKYLSFAALFAVIAMYTKNEGIVFSIVCFLWLIIKDPRALRSYLVRYASLISLVYLPWFIWIRGTLHLGSRHLEGMRLSGDTISRALDRLPDVLYGIGKMWIDVRQWNVVLAAAIGLSLWHFLRARGKRLELFVPWMMLLVFFVIQTFHREEVYLVVTSWNRMTVQVLPIFLITLCGIFTIKPMFRQSERG